MFLQTREMTYEEFFVELANCQPGSRYHPLNVIDVRTLPKAIYTVPKIVADNSINHLADREIGKSRTEPYSCSTSYYVLAIQDSVHTTWHQAYSLTSVFYTVLTGEDFPFSEIVEKNLSIFERWLNSENDTT